MNKLLAISFASLAMIGVASAAWAEDSATKGMTGSDPAPVVPDQNPGLGVGIGPPTQGGGANDMGQSTLRYQRQRGGGGQ